MSDAQLFEYRFTRDDLLKEIDRELQQRRIVYPRMVEAKKISAATMTRRIAMMERIRAIVAGDDANVTAAAIRAAAS